MINIPYRISAQFGNEPIKDNNNDEVVYLCPECAKRKGSPDTKGHLYVNVTNYKYHCHRCGWSGKLGYKKYDEKKDYHETVDTDTLEIVNDITNILDNNNNDIYKLVIPMDKVTESTAATKYLLDRGFTYEQMEYYDMRVGNNNKEFGRIIIPNRVNRLVYTDMYSARTYIGQTPKYHNPSEIKKSEIVFNLHRIRDNSPIILVEGALTAIAAGYHAVASLGKVLSVSQASQIAMKKPSCVYVNYDYGAEKENDDACKLLYSYLPNTPIYKVTMLDDRDAADLSTEEYRERLSCAVRYKPLLNDISTILN